MRGILRRRLLALGMSCMVAVGAMAADILPARAEPSGGGIKYTFTPGTLTAAADKEAIPEGETVGTEGYFTVKGNVTKRTSGDSVKYVEVAKAGAGALQFQVTGTADVVLVMASTGGSNTSAVGLADASGRLMDNAENVSTVTGTSGTTMTYAGLGAGEYNIISPENAEFGRGARILSVEVTEAGGGQEQEAADWSTVEAPVVSAVTVNEDGNFLVDFEASIDKLQGAEYAVISMQSNGFEVASKRIANEERSVEMIPYWSGDYTFVASIYRAGEAEKDSKPYVYKSYSMRLDKPVFRLLRSEGNGTVYVDWVDNERARDYTVLYKKTGDADFTKAADGLTQGCYRLNGLTVGAEYEIKVVVNTDETDPQTGARVSSEYSERITVADRTEHEWYAGIVGSSIRGSMTIKEANGTSHGDSYSTDHKYAPAVDITNTSGSISVPADSSGKISDDEDGFRYYFTLIDPNTENFKLTATFTVTDTSQTPDNQTGFGIIATDILPANMLGAQTITHKYVNSMSVMYYSARNSNPGMRYVTGNFSSDASDNETSERVNTYNKFSGSASFDVGNTYTFTLEKTDTAFIASMGDEKLTLDDTSLLSVQDDGSICVGVMTARKVGVDITDIRFETSESRGVSGAEKDERVKPSTRVYSTGATGSADYEYIYASNVAGTLTVTAPDGKALAPVKLEADSVARVNVPLNVGENRISSSFVPDSGANLTSYDPITTTTNVTCKQYGSLADYLYVAPDGSDTGDGTREKPLSLAAAVTYAMPGQVLMLTDGTYGGVTLERSTGGTADRYCVMRPENEGGVLFQGSGITLVGSYWHIYGMHVKGASGVGIQICGNNNIVEMCTVEGSGGTGIQISRTGAATNRQGIAGRLWPSDNLVKNCESFDNCDAGRNDADGFAAKLTCGEGNSFYGCISHNNIDDGWDLYAKTTSGEIGAVTIENCVAYNNGWLTADDISDPSYKYGEGNGFKLGGGYLKGGHKLINSVSFGNHGAGITSNSCPDCEIYDSTTYGNSTGISLGTMASMEKTWVVQGLLSLTADGKSDNVPWALHSVDNYFAMGKAVYNKSGEEGQASWFESVDVTVLPVRNENGTINMNGLLTLNGTAPAGSGARLDVSSDKAISVMPVLQASADKPVDDGEKPTQKPQDGAEGTAVPEGSAPVQDGVGSGGDKEASSGSVKTDGNSGSSAVGWVIGIAAAAVLAAGVIIARRVAGSGAAAKKKAGEKRTGFDVELTDAGAEKIGVIKVIREITGFDLKAAKDFVDGAPGIIRKGVSGEEAEDIKKKLEEAGAKVTLK